MPRRLASVLLALSFSLSVAGLGGCGLVQGPANGITTAAVKATGVVHGGQAPITGAAIQLWAVGTTGYATGATALISATVTTSDGTGVANSNANQGNANNTLAAGNFTLNFTNAYTCPSASTLVYLIASGGNPGLTAGTNNSAIVLMAPLGQCGALTSSTFVSINEVTTVAATFALQQFMTFTGVVGSPSTDTTSLANAFAEVNNLVNISTGVARSVDTAGNTVPQTTINTMANTVVPCVNSTGPTSSDCSTLFADIFSGLSPLTALSGLLDLAQFPNTNTSALFTLSTANAAFQPALSAAPHNWTVTLGNAGSLCGYSGSGYIVSGTVNYAGSKTGRIYLALTNTTCSGGGTIGWSIPAKGAYSIVGVPPGTYVVNAFMDTLGYGQPNAADPSGSAVTIPVNTSNIGNQNVTLADPSTVTLTSAPGLTSVSPFNTGFLAVFNPIKNNGIEAATSYTLQWSTDPAFGSIAGSKTFIATGTHQDTWGVNGLTDGSVYYLRAYGTSAGTPTGPISTVYGPVTIGAPSSGSTVSGSVSFTGAATGPMYAGLYNQYTNAVYLQYISSPGSSQAYSVVVPNSAIAVYQPVAFVDQNNDGMIDAGDLQNVEGNGAGISITANTANLNQTLPSGNSIAQVQTLHYSTGTAYTIGLQVTSGAKLPVGVTLRSSNNSDGANVTGPMNIALCGQTGTNCGRGFQIYFNLGNTAPTVGDTYYFSVFYSDATSETINAAVTGVLNNFATGLTPTTGSSVSTTPTFSWTAPVCGPCSSYVYVFGINPPNSSDIWDVPGNANGLPYSTTSLVWNVDPTSAGNTASVSSLTLGTNYSWNVGVVDSNGNQAIAQANYNP